MENRTYVWFVAYAYTVGPDALTELMQLEPSRVLIAGQPKPKMPTMTAGENAWLLDGPLPDTAPIEAQIEALLGLLEPRREALATLAAVHETKLGINCAIYYQDWTPGIHLPQSVVERLANLNLHLDLDLYFISNSEAGTE